MSSAGFIVPLHGEAIGHVGGDIEILGVRACVPPSVTNLLAR